MFNTKKTVKNNQFKQYVDIFDERYGRRTANLGKTFSMGNAQQGATIGNPGSTGAGVNTVTLNGETSPVSGDVVFSEGKGISITQVSDGFSFANSGVHEVYGLTGDVSFTSSDKSVTFSAGSSVLNLKAAGGGGGLPVTDKDKRVLIGSNLSVPVAEWGLVDLSSSEMVTGMLPVVIGGTGINMYSSPHYMLEGGTFAQMNRIAPNTSKTKKYLSMTGTGTAGATPTWEEVSSSLPAGTDGDILYYNFSVWSTLPIGTAGNILTVHPRAVKPGDPETYVPAWQAPFTAEDAQDAVGSILTDGGQIDFTYDDGAPKISAKLTDVKEWHYHVSLTSSKNNLLSNQVGVEGSTNINKYPDVPRTIYVSILSNNDPTYAGTLSFAGIDCNGDTVNYTRTVNIPRGGVSYFTVPYGLTKIGTVKITTTTGAANQTIINAGWYDGLGVGNYPFSSSSNLIFAKQFGVPATTFTLDATYGTITPSTTVTSGDINTFIVKSG